MDSLFTTNSSTTVGGDDAGYCDPWDVWAIVPLSVAIILFLSAAVMHCLAAVNPPAREAEHRIASYGRPWSTLHLIFLSAAWNLVTPPAVFLFFHHVYTVDPTSPLARVTCLAVYGNLPIITAISIVLGITSLLMYRPAPFVDAMTAAVFPAGELQRVAEQVAETRSLCFLVLGSFARGMYSAGLICRIDEQHRELKSRRADAVVPTVKVAPLATRHEWVESNVSAVCESVPFSIAPIGPRHPHAHFQPDGINTTVGATPVPFALASVASDTVDEVLLAPFFRRTPPIADLITPSSEEHERVTEVLREIFRVLRPGGTLRFCDSLLAVLATEHDLCTVGFDIVEPTTSCSGLNVGVMPCLAAPQYGCVAKKGIGQPLLSEATPIAPIVAEGPDAEDIFLHEGSDDGSDSARVPTEGSKLLPEAPRHSATAAPHISSTVGLLFVILLQALSFILLLSLAASVAAPLFIPKSIVAAARISQVFMSSVLNFPVFVFFARLRSTSAAPHRSWGAFIFHECRRIAFITLASFTFGSLVSLPNLCIQLALSKTMISYSTRSIAAFALMILIGIVLTKLSWTHGLRRSLKAAHCTEERYASLKNNMGHP